MTEQTIYKDISERTGGDVYIGVVGPVRSGKSTFIRKFMEELVIPNIENQYDTERTRDELPQSGSGKTVMTTEPKFIPDNAVSVSIFGNASMRVKMIDCVGYVVPDAIGQTENDAPRMVMTPWSEAPKPFAEAAEYGTKKVICDHSTICIVVTTDGTIGEIPRESYADAEERVIKELSDSGKPFAIVLNSAHPESDKSVELAYELEEKYRAPVALVNCMMLDTEDISHIIELVLGEFPVNELNVKLPSWTETLEKDHWLVQSLMHDIIKAAENIRKIKDVENAFSEISENPYAEKAYTDLLDMGNGNADVVIQLYPELYYKVMSELTGLDITGEDSLIKLMTELSKIKNEYDKIESALNDVNEKGYGVVMPDISEFRLDEPEIIKQPGGYGVKIRAEAPSIHMIKADLETEINPIVGTEQQSEDLIDYLMKEFDDDPSKIWESNIFGKTLHELVENGLNEKLSHITDESKTKLAETLERTINEGSGGLICIIL